jgi:hypothetical protein
MHIFLCRELFIKLELAGHLKDMLPAVVLCLSSFTKCQKGEVDSQCRCSPEGWSVGQRMIKDGLPVFTLFPDENQRLIVFLHPHPSWEWILVLSLLHPLMGRQEANPQLRYVFAVWYFDEMHSSLIVLNMKLECACALDC